jgi:uncharacterized protein
MKNIKTLLKNKFNVEARINIDHKNYKNIPELFQYFINHNLNDFIEFSPYLAYIQSYGKYKQQIKPVDIYEYFLKQNVFQNFDIGLDPLGIEKTLKDAILKNSQFAFTINHCGANKGTMLTFSPDGLIHPCWDSNPNDEPIGAYFPEIFWNNSNYIDNWLNRNILNIQKCSKCKYGLFCGGGCQYLAKLKYGDYFYSHCSGYQSTFNAVLKNIGIGCM